MRDVITQNSVHGHKDICMEKGIVCTNVSIIKIVLRYQKNDPCKVCLNILYRDRFFEILVNAIKNRNTYRIMFWVYLLTIL